MHLEDIRKHFERRAQQQKLVYALGPPTSDLTIRGVEQSLAIEFPAQIKDFYQFYNGLQVEEPHIEILPIEELKYIAPQRLHFATVDHQHEICFDNSHTNVAGQWNIVSATDYRITFTMASFWSNKLWAWIEKRRQIWESEPYNP